VVPGEPVAQYQLPVKIVLFDNHRLGMVQLEDVTDTVMANWRYL
jgi:thiamine pyrophosphate-dependent acetolactate synthase large subunit-like protein